MIGDCATCGARWAPAECEHQPWAEDVRTLEEGCWCPPGCLHVVDAWTWEEPR